MAEHKQRFGALAKVGWILVFLMAALQLLYALYAYLDPSAFSLTRGTELFDLGDKDWVRIYASRTLFVGLIVGYLLYARQFKILAMASLLGIVMPVTDALLAYQASADGSVVLKHVATALFLAVTFIVLRTVVRRGQSA
jgi:hypothetical protein